MRGVTAAAAFLLLFLADGRELPAALKSSTRNLQQTCPIRFCSTCLQRRGPTALCKACQAPRILNERRTECVCPPGQYPTSGGTCADCPQHHWCPRAATNQPAGAASLAQYARLCPPNTMTRRKGAASIAACLNAPGFVFTKDYPRSSSSSNSVPEASAAAVYSANMFKVVPCGDNAYSNGLDGATSCRACPTGFKTDPMDEIASHTSVAVCKAPPGFYIGGESVMPCPAGSFSSNYTLLGDCTDCEEVFGAGVTTQAEGANSSAACNVLEPGRAFVQRSKVVTDENDSDAAGGIRIVALDAGITTKACPQSFFCPGGTTPPTRCYRGMMTEGEGAVSEQQCVAPPGWFLPAEASQDMQECPSGTYKEGWDRAASCTPCGSGPWLSEQSEALDILDPDTSLTIAVNYTRGSTLSCYTQPGMGVIKVNNTLTAVICPVDFYGAATQRNGLLVNPCLQCPTGTVTAGDERAKQYNNAAGDSVAIAEGGYYSVASCVTPPGWGYYGDEAQECPQGYYNEGGNLLPCKQCPFGHTTASSGASSAADCSHFSPGYGHGPSGATALCPAGTYSTGDTPASQEPSCTPCPEGSTTFDAGAKSLQECSKCAAGYGRASETAACTRCDSGTYNPEAGRMLTDSRCLRCPVNRVWEYDWPSAGASTVFVPQAVSRPGAQNLADCLTDFSQTFDGAFFLDMKAGPEVAALERPQGDGFNLQV
uniref:Tyrosine-protein kinase ephrin type A/B receptor-like domain-containing protein n=1 Tax=Tetradesmus obliquus TaxID=3088 RepID=A0A383VHJ0_TETOB|eukprot:jgi/Sobl393_1/5477/SZX64403.1